MILGINKHNWGWLTLEIWDAQEVEPILVHHQEPLLDKEMKATAWVQQNLIKLHKMFGVDFQGHEE